jgi:hypothetical protein
MEVVMPKKLTLNLDEELILFAHSYAQQNDISISRLFEDYLKRLRSIDQKQELNTKTAALYGIFQDSPIPDKKELAAITCFGRPHIVILPIGGFYCLNASEALETANLLDPSLTAIMYHFKYGPLFNLDDFKPMADEKPFIQLAIKDTEIILKRMIDLDQIFRKFTIFG